MSTRMLLNSRFVLAHRYNDPKIVSLVHDLAFKSQIKLNVEFFEMLLDLSRVCTSPVRYNHTIEKQMDTSWLSSTSISACVASIRPQVLYPNGVACGRSFTTVANVESSSSSPTRTTSHGNSPLWTSLPSATLHRSRYARIDTEPRAVVSLTKISNQDESGMKRVRSLPLLQNTTKKMSNNDLTEPSLHRRLRSASRKKSPIIRRNRKGKSLTQLMTLTRIIPHSSEYHSNVTKSLTRASRSNTGKKARRFFAESKDKSITNQNALLTSGIPLVSFFALLPFLSSSSKMRIVLRKLDALLEADPRNCRLLCDENVAPKFLHMLPFVSDSLQSVMLSLITRLLMYDITSSQAKLIFRLAQIDRFDTSEREHSDGRVYHPSFASESSVLSTSSNTVSELQMLLLFMIGQLVERVAPTRFFHLRTHNSCLRFSIGKFPSAKVGYTISFRIHVSEEMTENNNSNKAINIVAFERRDGSTSLSLCFVRNQDSEKRRSWTLCVQKSSRPGGGRDRWYVLSLSSRLFFFVTFS